MSVIRDLRDAAVDESRSLPEVLRRAQILASSLRNDDLKRWVRKELDGYDSGDEAPDYREVPCVVLGQFRGPFGSGVKNAPIPTSRIDERLSRFISDSVKITHGVRTLEDWIKNHEEIRFPVPPEACMLLPPVYEDMVCVEMTKHVDVSAISQILDSVRNRLLDIVLELEEKFPEIVESEKAMEKVDKKEAGSIISTHIYGGTNIVASGTHFTQTVQQRFEPNDFEGLLRVLDGIGVSPREKEELREAVAEDGKPKEGKLGKRVVGWIGKVTQRLLEGGITAATTAAPGVITEALSRYYGWK